MYEQKPKDCERSGSYQHKVKHLLCPKYDEKHVADYESRSLRKRD